MNQTPNLRSGCTLLFLEREIPGKIQHNQCCEPVRIWQLYRMCWNDYRSGVQNHGIAAGGSGDAELIPLGFDDDGELGVLRVRKKLSGTE